MRILKQTSPHVNNCLKKIYRSWRRFFLNILLRAVSVCVCVRVYGSAFRNNEMVIQTIYVRLCRSFFWFPSFQHFKMMIVHTTLLTSTNELARWKTFTCWNYSKHCMTVKQCQWCMIISWNFFINQSISWQKNGSYYRRLGFSSTVFGLFKSGNVELFEILFDNVLNSRLF